VADKPAEDPQLTYVIGRIWNQVSNMNRLNKQTGERHKVERENLQQHIELMTNELLAAEKIIHLLSSERQRLMADCRELTQKCGVQKETLDNFQKQLDEKNTMIAEKDK